jgi:hypothetical protein
VLKLPFAALLREDGPNRIGDSLKLQVEHRVGQRREG